MLYGPHNEEASQRFLASRASNAVSSSPLYIYDIELHLGFPFQANQTHDVRGVVFQNCVFPTVPHSIGTSFMFAAHSISLQFAINKHCTICPFKA